MVSIGDVDVFLFDSELNVSLRVELFSISPERVAFIWRSGVIVSIVVVAFISKLKAVLFELMLWVAFISEETVVIDVVELLFIISSLEEVFLWNKKLVRFESNVVVVVSSIKLVFVCWVKLKSLIVEFTVDESFVLVGIAEAGEVELYVMPSLKLVFVFSIPFAVELAIRVINDVSLKVKLVLLSVEFLSITSLKLRLAWNVKLVNCVSIDDVLISSIKWKSVEVFLDVWVVWFKLK